MLSYIHHRQSSTLPLPQIDFFESRLKEEHAELKKRESSDAKQMYDLQQKNKQLAEPLKKAQQDVDRLQEEAQLYAQDKKRLANVKAKIKEQEAQLSTRAFQSEVLTLSNAIAVYVV